MILIYINLNVAGFILYFQIFNKEVITSIEKTQVFLKEFCSQWIILSRFLKNSSFS